MIFNFTALSPKLLDTDAMNHFSSLAQTKTGLWIIVSFEALLLKARR
jgi:hypothetical protein